MNSRFVTLPAGAKHTHEDVTYYGPCTIELPEDDAEWLASAVIEARIERANKAKKIPVTPEAQTKSIKNEMKAADE